MRTQRHAVNGIWKELSLRGLTGDEAYAATLFIFKSMKGYRAQDASIISMKKMAPFLQENWSDFTTQLDRHGYPRIPKTKRHGLEQVR